MRQVSTCLSNAERTVWCHEELLLLRLDHPAPGCSPLQDDIRAVCWSLSWLHTSRIHHTVVALAEWFAYARDGICSTLISIVICACRNDLGVFERSMRGTQQTDSQLGARD